MQATTTKPAVRSGAQEIPQTRRQFLAKTGSLAAFGGLASLGIDAIQPALAQGTPTRLVIDRRILEVLGRAAPVYGIRQINGTSGIMLGPGEPFIIDLENRLAEETIIHWHGQTPPYPQDGVVSHENPSLLAGASRRYDYSPRSGTHWMHSQFGPQQQLLLAAPMIVRAPEETRADVQEVTILLADFTFRDPAEILDQLRQGAMTGDMPGMSGGSNTEGISATSQIEELAPDLNDVDYDAFLANDRTLEDPQVIAVELGGRVRLRIINGATTSAFHVDLGRLEGTIIAVDGNPVRPVSGRRFGIAVAQRLDILVAMPRGMGAYPVLAQREGEFGRTGLILASSGARVVKISSRAEAPMPPVDMSLEEKLVALMPLAERPADIAYRVALTGDMRNYIWSIEDRTWGNHRPLNVRIGQRVVVEMRNMTMMPHPMHLGGHHFQVIGVNGRALRGAVRDTVLVPPDESVTVAFDADNAGRWFFQCHNLFHSEAGMKTEVIYEA